MPNNREKTPRTDEEIVSEYIKAIDQGFSVPPERLRTILKEVREEERVKAKSIVVDEHYKLEEWFALHPNSSPQLWEAHQRSMRTRNDITKALTTPN